MIGIAPDPTGEYEARGTWADEEMTMQRIVTVGLALLAVACDVEEGADEAAGFDGVAALDGELVAEDEPLENGWDGDGGGGDGGGGVGYPAFLTLDTWVENGEIKHRLHCGEGFPNGWGGCSCNGLPGVYEGLSVPWPHTNYCVACEWSGGVCEISNSASEVYIDIPVTGLPSLRKQHSYAQGNKTKVMEGDGFVWWDLMRTCAVGGCSYGPGVLNFATLMSYDDGAGPKIASAENQTICVEGSCP